MLLQAELARLEFEISYRTQMIAEIDALLKAREEGEEDLGAAL